VDALNIEREFITESFPVLDWNERKMMILEFVAIVY
jgi:hypothetical protein